MVTATTKDVVRDGVKLAYLDVGTGDPPLLFIHGWCCDHGYWRDQIPEFTQRHHVVAVDLRGMGESDKPEQDYDIAGFADDVAWLIRKIGLDRPVLIGHSMGGVIALKLLREHADLARAAVFVDSYMAPLSADLQPLVGQMLEGLKSPAYRDVASNFISNFLFRAESPSQLRDEVVKRMTSAPQRLMHPALASTLSEENFPAGALPVPSLFVRAATLPATEEQLAERYPGLEVVSVDAAHFVQMEKPQEFNAILSRFLEKVV